MGKVVLDTEVAARIRDKLRNQEVLVKTAEEKAQEAMEKVAAIQQELEITRGVLQLIAEGQIDPNDATDKVAEFMADPMRFQVTKSAHELGIDRFETRLGEPVSESQPKSGGKNPIADCFSDLLDRGVIG
jgi:hypothetical protein